MHVVVDAGIDGANVRDFGKDSDERLRTSTIVRPDELAQQYLALQRQPRSVWTQELDIRPWSETW